MNLEELPRLAICSDVPVEAAASGAAFLYRLFADYPPDRLKIISPDYLSKRTAPLLSGVDYLTTEFLNPRWLNSRICSWYSLSQIVWQRKVRRQLKMFLDELAIDTLFLISHGYSWLAAAHLAKKREIPYVVFSMDDWASVCPVPDFYRNSLRGKFDAALAGAQSVFCASKAMREFYSSSYRGSLHVLYPPWSDDSFNQATIKRTEGEPFCLAFTGTLGAWSDLDPVIQGLKRIKGKLLVFSNLEHSPYSPSEVSSFPIADWTMVRRSLLESADVVLVTQGFSSRHQLHEQLNFKMKIADYCQLGRPIFIWAPPQSSSVRWWRENTQPGYCCQSPDPEEVAAVIAEMQTDKIGRQQQGEAALRIGQGMFAARIVLPAFHQVLAQTLTIKG